MISRVLRIKAGRPPIGTAGAAGAHWIALGETGVKTRGIAMPNVDGRVRQWLAASRIEHKNAQGQRYAGSAFDDVGPEEFLDDVVRPLLLFGNEPAHLRIDREAGGVGGTSKLQCGRESCAGNEETAPAYFGSLAIHASPGAQAYLPTLGGIDVQSRREDAGTTTRLNEVGREAGPNP